jgi:molybdopterin-containing oxidoreductase family membrane subunit
MDYLYYNAFSDSIYPMLCWFLVIGNFALPLFCLAFQEFRRSIMPMFVLSIIVNIAMYIERVFIVIPGLEIYNGLNFNTIPYTYSATEVAIICGTFGWVIGGLTLFCRIFPILPYWELAETKARQVEVDMAGVKVAYFHAGE